ncbi:hypothetical protein [Streptomyces sp. NPDC008137]|uniref:hypothetical protein n=1 Tax=Streptomyces sp. NPDC008137 TaxID=3364813 RepID=UPI0036E04B31
MLVGSPPRGHRQTHTVRRPARLPRPGRRTTADGHRVRRARFYRADSRGRVPDDPAFTYHNLSIEDRPYNQAAPALLADWTSRNDGRSPTWPSFGRAPAEVMHLFLTDLTNRYGSTTGYVTDALELDAPAFSATLRECLLHEPTCQPFTQTTCFSFATTSTRSRCWSMTCSMGL